MSKFKSSQIDIKKEFGTPTDVRVVKLDKPEKSVVEQYSYPKIKRMGEGDYATTKAKFGALAATDMDRVTRTRKDARFMLNPLLRDPLSVEEEERRVIEEKVRTRVTAVADEAKAKAEAIGYEDGKKKGYDESYRKFREEAVERLHKFDTFLAECESAKAEIFRANERFLIEMIFRISRMVMLRELTTDKEYLLRLASDLLERVGVRENIRIKISQEDLATAGMLKEGLEKTLGALKNVNIEGSNQVKRGGCMIETEWNAIDASIETQLQGIYEALVAGKTGSNSA